MNGPMPGNRIVGSGTHPLPRAILPGERSRSERSWRAVAPTSLDEVPSRAGLAVTNIRPSMGPRSVPACVLVVDDAPSMREMITSFVSNNGMRAVAASGRHEMIRHLGESEPDLVVLGHPFGQDDGLDLLRAIRSSSDLPVIMITEDRGDDIDRVLGLELGADDCLTKPFGLRELLARIRVVLRRRDAARAAAQRRPAREICRFGGWQLDRRARRLTDPKGVTVALTKGEHGLLTVFLDAPQRPLSREYLLRAIRVHADIFDRSIDVQVLRLRRKLEPDPRAPRIIHTERGVGYAFQLPVERL